jgi:hypothetical protein
LPDKETRRDEFKEGIEIGKGRMRERFNIGEVAMNTVFLTMGSTIVLFLLGAFAPTRFLWTFIVVILGAYFFVDWAIDTFFSVEKESSIDETGKGVKVSYHAYYLPYAKPKDRKELTPKKAYIVFLLLVLITTIIGGLVLTGAQILDAHIPLWMSSLVWSVLVSVWLYTSYLRLFGEKITLRHNSPTQTPPPEEEETLWPKESEPEPPSDNSGQGSTAPTS